jgi:aspartyl-tRNA(Asn)/glutamyl-tRNA(Gln) amidotransferase subunit C
MMKKTFKLSEEEVKHVAKLAKLNLTPQEVKKFQEQLSEVLAYIEVLKDVKTEKIEPTSQVTSLENVSRKDKTNPSLSQKEVLSGAKENHQGLFKIKRILDND